MKWLPIVAIACLLLGACSGSSKGGTATASIASPETTAVAATQTPATINGVPVRAFTVGARVPLPNGYLVLRTCNGNGRGRRKLFNAPIEPRCRLRVDILYETKLTGSPPDGPAISSVAASADGASIAIGVCRGFCYGETGPITVASSVDSGITWSQLGTVNAGGWVRGAGNGSALVQTPTQMVVLPANDGKTTPIPGRDDVLVMGSDPLPIALIRSSDGVHPDAGGRRYFRSDSVAGRLQH